VALAIDVRAFVNVGMMLGRGTELKICNVIFYIRRMKAEIL
jgi:hypothetical protein